MAPLYKNFIFNEERGFIFAYTPKVACTNWKSIMRYLASAPDYLDNRLAHDKVKSGLRFLDFSGPDIRYLKDPGLRKYAFVRSPHSRILSAYLNKVESNLPLKDPAHGEDHWVKVSRAMDAFRTANLNTAHYPDLSFEVFLRFLNESGSHFRFDEHWQSQAILLRWPEVKFDFIGRFENLGQDAAYVLKEIGCDIPFPTQKEVNFIATDASSKLTEYLTQPCRKLLLSLYEADFTAFGYDPRL